MQMKKGNRGVPFSVTWGFVFLGTQGRPLRPRRALCRSICPRPVRPTVAFLQSSVAAKATPRRTTKLPTRAGLFSSGHARIDALTSNVLLLNRNGLQPKDSKRQALDQTIHRGNSSWLKGLTPPKVHHHHPIAIRSVCKAQKKLSFCASILFVQVF